MSDINCNNCAISDFKESLCHRCAEMKRLGRAEDIEGLLIKAFSKVDSPAKSDCISRQAAIDALGDKPLAWTEGEYELGLQQQWEADVNAIKALPSAQPEIIRCKDCKHYVIHTFFGRSQGWCERLCDEFDKSLARGTEADDYCSRAEREGNE